jgi:predicted Fe-Mo cluster-binding NifX family protein
MYPRSQVARDRSLARRPRAGVRRELGQHAFARMCGVDEIDVIVTDRDAAPASLAAFTERGIRVVTA